MVEGVRVCALRGSKRRKFNLKIEFSCKKVKNEDDDEDDDEDEDEKKAWTRTRTRARRTSVKGVKKVKTPITDIFGGGGR